MLPHCEAAAHEYGGKDQRHGHHCAGVAHGQLPETIAHAVGPGSHWMVMEMALDVVGQRIHRGVAILRPMGERFEHDRVEIAAHGTASARTAVHIARPSRTVAGWTRESAGSWTGGPPRRVSGPP